MNSHDSPRERLADLREWLMDRIDGSIETRGEDGLISDFIRQIDALPSEKGTTDPVKNPAILSGLPQLATKDDLSRHLGDNSQQVANYATPRTDAYEHNMGSITEPHYVVDADFSRTLERENANLRAENLRLKVACDQYSEDEMLRPIDDLRRQLDRMRVSTVQQELEMEGLREQLAAKQAELDRVMLEYCPDEMTEAQLAEWAKHQKTAKEST